MHLLAHVYDVLGQTELAQAKRAGIARKIAEARESADTHLTSVQSKLSDALSRLAAVRESLRDLEATAQR